MKQTQIMNESITSKERIEEAKGVSCPPCAAVFVCLYKNYKL